jgi:predicted SnoaL-like aldol condensation-catalyzing enzyme
MKRTLLALAFAAGLALPSAALAQVAVTPAADQLAQLNSPDAKLAYNKKLVFDLWRTVVIAGHAEDAPKFVSEGYIQHNPMVPTGRAPMMKFFQTRCCKDIPPTIPNMVSLVAEGDMVVLATVRNLKDAGGQDYTSTWFDMFRIENGLVAEHWDTATKPSAPPPGPPPPPAH